MVDALQVAAGGLTLLAFIALFAAMRRGTSLPLSPLTVVVLAFLPVSSAFLGPAWVVADPSALGPNIPLGLAFVASSFGPVLVLLVGVAYRLMRGAPHLPRAVLGLLALFPITAGIVAVASLLAYSDTFPLLSQFIPTGAAATMILFLVSGLIQPRGD